MNQQELREYLDRFASRLESRDRSLLQARLESLVSVFPFSEYEFILMFLLDREIIDFKAYEKLRDNYVSSNRYLDLYGLAPRIFGQVWGEQHLIDLDARMKKANVSLDPSYEGEYDLWVEGVKVEVKACRAFDKRARVNLIAKALHFDSERPFWMNFQQLKLGASDVFVFIGVWVDRIIYWVLSDNDVRTNAYLSHQHRGGIEYQIGITDKNIDEFGVYRTEASELCDKVISLGTST